MVIVGGSQAPADLVHCSFHRPDVLAPNPVYLLQPALFCVPCRLARSSFTSCADAAPGAFGPRLTALACSADATG